MLDISAWFDLNPGQDWCKQAGILGLLKKLLFHFKSLMIACAMNIWPVQVSSHCMHATELAMLTSPFCVQGKCFFGMNTEEALKHCAAEVISLMPVAMPAECSQAHARVSSHTLGTWWLSEMHPRPEACCTVYISPDIHQVNNMLLECHEWTCECTRVVDPAPEYAV